MVIIILRLLVMKMWYDDDNTIIYYFEPNRRGKKQQEQTIEDLRKDGYQVVFGFDISGRYYVKVVGKEDGH